MADLSDTVYAAEPHTKAKHDILRDYLKRWSAILAESHVARRSGRLLYVDGFAGPGEYSDKSPGSPLVAIDTVLDHSREFQIPVHMKFIEERADRVEHLRGLIASRRSRMDACRWLKVDDPAQSECEPELVRLLEQHEREGKPLGPAFFFLDQYGYRACPMNLISRLLRHDSCEVFVYLNWNRLHPYMKDPDKNPAISGAFGGDEWKPIADLRGVEKANRFRDAYLAALRMRGGAKYSYAFAMRDDRDLIIYWLFFCSKNIEGLRQMKTAMWQVDRTGGFEFSDKYATSAGHLFSCDDAWLADRLAEDFDGQRLSVAQVEEHVLVRTPCYKFREALGVMEDDGRVRPVNPPERRRRRSFNDPRLTLEFSRRAHPKQHDLF